MKSRYGLIGYPLGHSFSKSYFTEKFKKNSIEAVYDLFPLEQIESLDKLLQSEEGLVGLNVTIPFKQQVIPLLDKISEEATDMNSVNVIKILRRNSNLYLEGYNTDAPAFESELIDLAGEIAGNALILGTGGAASSVAYILKKRGWEIQYVSRNPQSKDTLGYSEITEFLLKQTRLIVNATPVGMFPYIDKCPVFPYHLLSNEHYLFDLIYNPDKTLFLQKGELQGAKIKNGLGMLYKQAELAWEIWQK